MCAASPYKQDAIRLLMRRIADEHRLPFDVKAFNATTNYNESTNLIDSF